VALVTLTGHFGTKTVRHQSEMTVRQFGTKTNWCRSVLVPKCPDTLVTEGKDASKTSYSAKYARVRRL